MLCGRMVDTRTLVVSVPGASNICDVRRAGMGLTFWGPGSSDRNGDGVYGEIGVISRLELARCRTSSSMVQCAFREVCAVYSS